MINTIFYYPQSLTLELYRDKVGSTIADRTIVFAEDQKAIYKGGVKYGVTSVEDLDTNELKNKIQEILRNNPSTLPIATTSKLGGIIVGNFLDINTTNGKLGVDISALFSNSDTINAIKSIINPAYIISNQEKLQPATDSRLGGIIKGNYLSINESGKLDVDLESVISAISGNNTFISFLNGRTYTLPTASASTKGGIKIGNGLSMNGESLNIDIQYIRTNIGSLEPTGIPVATSEAIGGIRLFGTGASLSGKNYAVKLDESNRAYVTVPWESGQQQQQTSSGIQRMYFLNIASGSTPSTVSTSAYQSGSDTFVVGQQTWTRTNTNPSSGQDTYALWAWFVDGSPTSIEGPVRIYRYVAGGTSSTNGEDSEEIEWIYARFTSKPDATSLQSLTTALNAYNGSSKISSTATIGGVTWTNHPTGIDTEYKYEYASYRPSRNDANGSRYWGAVGFSAPVLWSAYGERGTDGDGVEYIYYKGTTAPSGNADPSTWSASLEEEYTGPQNYGWTDNPSDLTTLGEKQWVSVRKKQDGVWGRFSSPALWGYFAQDGVVDGYTIDLTNENMPVGTDTRGNVSSYTNTCGIQVFHNGSALSYTSSTPSEGYFTASVGTVTRSDSGSTSGISASISSGTLTVSLSNVTGLVAANIYVPITVTLPNSSTRNVVVTVFAVNVGEAGAAIDLYTSAAAIRTDYYLSVAVPSSIEVGVKISSSSGVNKYLAGSTYASNNGYSFRYHYNDDSSWTTLSTSSISSLTATSSSITIQMLYNGSVIDQETIPFVRDGRPGVGISAVNYSICVFSSTVAASTSGNSTTVSGKICFGVNKTTGANTVEMTSDPFTGTGGDNETLTVTINDNTVTPTYNSSTGEWEATLSSTSFNALYPFSQILVQSASNDYVASTTIPIIQNGRDGEDGNSSTQGLDAVVMRFRSYDAITSTNGDGYGNIQNGTTAYTDGVKYKDIILFDGTNGDNDYYYVTTANSDTRDKTWATNNPPSSNGTTNTGWVKLNNMGDASFRTLLAKYAYVDNMTVNEIVVTKNSKPVAGISSGSAVDSELVNHSAIANYTTSTTSNGNVRIWAGFSDSTADLKKSKFYVTDEGFLHAENADVSGKITASSGNDSVTIDSSGLTGRWSNDGIKLSSSGLQRWHPGKSVWTDLYASRSISVASSSSYTASIYDDFIISASGNTSITLPSGVNGKVITIKTIGHTVNVYPASGQYMFTDHAFGSGESKDLNTYDRGEFVYYNGYWYWNAMGT